MQTAFSEGDEAAVGILRGAADELEGPRCRSRAAGLIGEAFTVHPVGRHLPRGPVAGAGAAGGGCRLAAPRQRTSCSIASPPSGAVALALQEAHGGARIPVYKH